MDAGNTLVRNHAATIIIPGTVEENNVKKTYSGRVSKLPKHLKD